MAPEGHRALLFPPGAQAMLLEPQTHHFCVFLFFIPQSKGVPIQFLAPRLALKNSSDYCVSQLIEHLE